MSIPWPDEASEQWNACTLGGLALPGLAKLDVELSEKLDVKSPTGGNGATITRQGLLPARVSIALRLWEPAQFARLQEVLPLLRPKVGKSSGGPLAIVHPKAALWGVAALLVEKILDRNGERGDLYDLTFECIEHSPPPKTKATKTDGKGDRIGDRDNAIRLDDARPSVTNRGP